MSCHFIPPYLLRRIAAPESGDHLSRCGSRTLLVDDRLRSARETTSPQTQLLKPAARGTRVVHDAEHQEALPGRPVRRDGDGPTGNVAVDEAFVSAEQVWDLFADVFGRRSADGQGTPLTVTVHYSRNYDNAFWDGRQLVFGDGDGDVFDRFTKPMDVMAHEFTHGVTQFTAGLIYAGQSGALNESVSDVFAALARQRVLGQQVDQADWLIGKGLFLPGVQARALRSMIEPGTAYDDPRLGRDPQVASMADYDDGTEDNGGVHINSGIPNRAFALAAVALGGQSWDRAGPIWYAALTAGQVKPDADFASFARATVAAATRLYGAEAATVVTQAWTTVGVLTRTPKERPRKPVPPAPDLVAVQRSGGFTGRTTSAELNLGEDPRGPEVRSLMQRVTAQEPPSSQPGPDRFVYTVRYGAWHLRVPEQDLTPELHRVVMLVLNHSEIDLS